MDALLPQARLFRAQGLVVHQGKQLVQALVVCEHLELHSRCTRVGIRVVRDQVAAAEFGRIHAELLGREVHDPLGQRHGNRMADGAVLAGHVLVGEHDIESGAVIPVLVGAAREVHDLVTLDPAGARVHRIRADRGQVVQVEGEDLALLRGGKADRDLVLARMDVRQKRFQPVGDELDRAAQHHRERGGAHFVRVHVHLDPVGTADVPAEYAHVRLGKLQMLGEDVLHHVRGLGRLMHCKCVFRDVVIGQDRAALEAYAGVPAKAVALFDHDVGFGECGVHFAVVDRTLETDVVLELRVDHGLAGQRSVHVDHGGQRVPLGLDQLAGVLGLGARLGDHRGHRLALPAGTLDGQRMLRRRLDPLQVPQHADPGGAEFGDRASVDDGDHARRGARLGEIEPQDLRVRMRAAQEHDMSETGKTQIVDVGAAPLQQAFCVGARFGLADVTRLGARFRIPDRNFGARVHARTPLRRATSTTSIASTIAW